MQYAAIRLLLLVTVPFLTARIALAQELPVEQEAVHTFETELDELLIPVSHACAPACETTCDGCCQPGSVWCRPTLTGDWCGLRSHLRESGVNFRGTITQFGFGIEGGINQPVPAPFGQGDTVKYTGRGEYDLIINSDKAFQIPGGALLIGAQHWWGEFGNVGLRSGAFAPSVFPAALPPTPDNQGQLFLTDFLWTQALSKQCIVFAGKKNVIGAADQDIFAGGDGTDQFMNQALIANPAYLLALPYSSYTAGVVLPRSWGMVTAYVWDPTDRTTDVLSLDGLFDEGIILGSQIKVNTNFFNLPGEHHFGGLWKHIDLIDLRTSTPPNPEYPYPSGSAGTPTLSDSYTIYYGFDQYFQVFPGERRSPAPRKPPRGWGMFGRASISDGNPTPYEYFLSLGIGGDTRFGNDRGDTFGLGWYFNGVTDKFGPLGQALFGPREGTGVEFFYNYQATPWLNITADLQYVRPGISTITSGDDAFLYGLRVNIRL